MSNAFGNIPRSEKSKGFGVISAFLKRLLHAFARYLPMFPSWRVTIHRLRGVEVGKNVFIGTEVFIDDVDPSLVIIEDEVTYSILYENENDYYTFRNTYYKQILASEVSNHVLYGLMDSPYVK